jgi:hypothetical protein
MSGVHPIIVGGVRITEVATMVTDFAIAIICVAFALGIEASDPGVLTARGIWALSFAFTAVAATIGGVVHGFARHLRPAAKHRLWKATQYTMGLTALAIFAGGAMAFLDGALERVMLVVAVAKFVAYLAVVPKRDDYSVVVTNYAVSMAAVATLAAFGWLSHGAPAAPWLVGGVVVSAVAAAIQLTKVTPHPRFNHNDLYHVVQMAALYLFYRGGLLLVDR